MPPTDTNGNVVVKATHYVRLVIAGFTLFGIVSGAALTAGTMIYTRGVEAEKHRAVDAARDERIGQLSSDVTKLSGKVEALTKAVERMDRHT